MYCMAIDHVFFLAFPLPAYALDSSSVRLFLIFSLVMSFLQTINNGASAIVCVTNVVLFHFVTCFDFVDDIFLFVCLFFLAGVLQFHTVTSVN